MNEERIYKILFLNQGDTYEIYARSVGQGNLYGFIEIEELIFGAKSQLVVDPSEERLRTEFEGVRRTYIPMHCVLRVDEVERERPGRVTQQSTDAKVSQFPATVYTRGPKGGGEG
ncbi:MAG: DUF1820 family protein [Acidobacteriota bacterium]